MVLESSPRTLGLALDPEDFLLCFFQKLRDFTRCTGVRGPFCARFYERPGLQVHRSLARRRLVALFLPGTAFAPSSEASWARLGATPGSGFHPATRGPTRPPEEPRLPHHGNVSRSAAGRPPQPPRFQTALGVSVPLSFHINVRMIPSVSTKGAAGFSIRAAVSPCVSPGSTGIFAARNAAVRRHGVRPVR